MNPLTFYGCSDDTFGEYGRTNDDHDNCANGKPIRFLVESKSENKGVFVVGHYSPGNTGGWMVGVEPTDTDERMIPAWPMRLRAPHGGTVEAEYSMVLEIDAPADATVTHVG